MKKQHYTYVVKGSGAEAQTWTASGTAECELADVWRILMNDTFAKLTAGKAVYGQPGVGCSGPYDVHSVTIERVRR